MAPVWRHEHGVMSFCTWGSANPLANPCVLLIYPPCGLKWHVMNDFAEPESFMHELQLSVCLSSLKATAPFDRKAAKGAIAYIFKHAAGDRTGFNAPSFMITFLVIFAHLFIQ